MARKETCYSEWRVGDHSWVWVDFDGGMIEICEHCGKCLNQEGLPFIDKRNLSEEENKCRSRIPVLPKRAD